MYKPTLNGTTSKIKGKIEKVKKKTYDWACNLVNVGFSSTLSSLGVVNISTMVFFASLRPPRLSAKIV